MLRSLRHALPALGMLSFATSSCRDRPQERTEVSPLVGVASASELPSRAPLAANAGRADASTVMSDAGSSATAPRPSVYAKTRYVWIREEPDGDTQWIGYLWIGGQAALKSTEPRSSPACKTWYAVEPRGWVCVNGENATLDANDPTYLALKKYGPDLSSPWPHRYAESRGAERYREIPTAQQQRQREWDVDAHLARLADAGATRPALLPSPAAPIDIGKPPPTIYENRTRLRPRSTVAYAAETEAQGRSWLLTHDFMWVPKDRVSLYPKIEFRGVELGKQAELPLAFFRGKDRPKYRRLPSGEFVETGASFPRLSHVGLTAERHEVEKDAYLLTREPGIYVKEKDAVIPTPQKKTPWGAPVGGEDTTGLTPRGRATWIEVSVWKGWLIAYEGTRPVYATLISPGRGGTPVPDKDPLETASTPTGTFKITGKFATATMEAPNEFIHSDVPWTQNFSGPHALHGAYWHDDWGNRKSAGCVNVSPVDGRWLFHFTEPVMPDGWHGLRWLPYLEPATTFIVHQ